MRVLWGIDKKQALDSESAKFLAQAWYSLVHSSSLDSHRVRCMNPVNILRELIDLIEKLNKPNFSKKIDKDIKLVCLEAREILSADVILQEHFKKRYDEILPYLTEVGESAKLPTDKFRHLSFLLKDLFFECSTDYMTLSLSLLLQFLEGKIAEEDALQCLSGLLSYLVDSGYSIESVYSFCMNILIHNKSEESKGALNNLTFLSRVLTKDRSDYEITFKIYGFEGDNSVPEKIGDITLKRAVAFDTPDAKLNKFCEQKPNAIFGSIAITAKDDRSSGQKAKKKLDDILDLLRFELIIITLRVDDTFVSKRLESGKVKIFKIPNIIPNPKRFLSHDDFSSMLSRLDRILVTDQVERETKNKLLSAFRFYRLGADTDNHENKFLNWWTAVEYIVRTGEEGAIIGDVENNLTKVLLVEYFKRQLDSYRSSIIHCRIEPGREAVARFAISSFKDVELFTFYSMLIDQAVFNELLSQLAFNPFVRHKLDSFGAIIKNTDRLKNWLSRHQTHLHWHLRRLYRIRCDIVHSAEYSLELTLVCANLEYYLKSLINSLVEKFGGEELVYSLPEYFNRLDYECYKIFQDLNNESVDVLLTTIN